MNVSYFELFLIENQGFEGEEIGEGGRFAPDLRAGCLHFFEGLHHVFDGFFVLDVDGCLGREGGREGGGEEEGVRLVIVSQEGGEAQLY